MLARARNRPGKESRAERENTVQNPLYKRSHAAQQPLHRPHVLAGNGLPPNHAHLPPGPVSLQQDGSRIPVTRSEVRIAFGEFGRCFPSVTPFCQGPGWLQSCQGLPSSTLRPDRRPVG